MKLCHSVIFAAAMFAASALYSSSALAALQPGDAAPDFTTEASLAGKPFSFSLAAALKKGPVVLYFYPAAFTKGCTIEAHEFADAADRFAALGATVIGVSADNIEKLNKFSVTECRNKFPVAADPDLKIIHDYDVKLPVAAMSNRTSYVISPEGKILFAYSDLSSEHHVGYTLKAVQDWAAAHPAGK